MFWVAVVWGTGILSIIVSLTLCWKSYKMLWVCGTAIAIESLVDATNDTIVLLFQSHLLITGSNEIDVAVSNALRLFIFLSSFVASVHLLRRVGQYQHERRKALVAEGIAEAQGRTIDEMFDECDQQLRRISRSATRRHRNNMG